MVDDERDAMTLIGVRGTEADQAELGSRGRVVLAEPRAAPPGRAR